MLKLFLLHFCCWLNYFYLKIALCYRNKTAKRIRITTIVHCTLYIAHCKLKKGEQVTGIEPAHSAWEADVLPLYDTCIYVIRKKSPMTDYSIEKWFCQLSCSLIKNVNEQVQISRKAKPKNIGYLQKPRKLVSSVKGYCHCRNQSEQSQKPYE